MMSCIATVGKCGITTKPSYTNQQINSVIPDPSVVDSRFLYYTFKQLGSELEAVGSGGSVYTNVSKSRFSNIRITIPSDIKEQRAIAHILGTLDDKIELNERMNRTLEAIAQAIFKSWFVDFEPLRGGEFVDSDLGRIPKGWEVVQVVDLGKVITGKTPSTADPSNYGGQIPFIRIPDMNGRIFVTSTEKYLSEKGALSQSNKELPPLSVCVSCIATPGLVCLTAKPSHTNQQINSIVCKQRVSPYYVYLTIRQLSNYIARLGSGGTATLNLNKRDFSSIKLLLPPRDILKAFDQVIKPFFDHILSNRLESETLTQTRDALLPRLIRGGDPGEGGGEML